MIKTLMTITIVGILGARIIPAVFIGVGAMLPVPILCIVSFGLSPLLITTGRAKDARTVLKTAE